ncbi:TPA: phage major tail protein, TP901-1 family [Streptococcus suis]|nr:phage major tail protein, TP901-1 family [Streptococcus suis]
MSEEKKNIEITTAKPITGNKIYYFIQSVDAELGSAAMLPAYRTDGNTTLGGEYLDEQTQQGRLVEKSTDEHSVDLTQYFAPADPSIGVVEEASRTGKSIKVWEVIADESVKKNEGGKDSYPTKFGYAKVADFERNNAVGEFVEVSWTGNIIGSLKDGYFPLTKGEIEMLNSVYEYQNPGETTGDYDNIQKKPTSAPGVGG